MSIRSGFFVFMIVVTLSGCTNNTKKNNEGANFKQASTTNVQLGVGYINRGQYEIAEQKLLKAIELDSDNVDAYTTMAFLLMQIKKIDKAEDYYLDALDIEGDNPELHNSYGTYLCRVGRIDEAIEQFKVAYNHPFYKIAYLAYSNAGTCLLQGEKYADAEKMLRYALKIRPKLSGALISMSELSIKTKKYMSARAYIQRYHAINKPSSESLWLQIQAERALGAKDLYQKYEKQLLNEFAGSKQAALVKEQVRRDRNK